MLKSCKYCGRIHDTKLDCGKRPKRKKEPTQINKFRWSRRWREKAQQIKERDNYLCQVCKDNDRYTHDDLEVHHIVPLEEDYNLRLDDDNLITLCVTHHKQADRGEISREYLKGLIDIPPAIEGLIF
jgi:5-methylcytosine-specific restriction endonuclease McrA